MQVNSTTVHEFLSRLRSSFQENNDPTRKYANEPPPLRAELYNISQMEEHGRALAKKHKVSRGKAKDLLLKRLADNEQILVEVRNLLAEAIKEKRQISPGGEWILDNFYLIEEQIRTGKRHLPKGYSQGLPWLTEGPSAGLPRVYDIVLEIISHSDGRIDIDNLGSFIKAYQEVATLQLGELWAIPIMLRLALIENLRRVSARIAIDRINQNLADYWSNQMIETSEQDPKSLILVIADMARSGPPMESSFVAELTRQLIWKGPALTLPLTWMEQRLSESGMTSNDLVNNENQKQAADQVSISNSIGSLRFVGSMEWRDFVESMSLVEQTLQRDSLYGRMDFPTRDHYRHMVEKIAKHSPLSEHEVAAIAIKLSEKHATKTVSPERAAHVGYYLVDKGAAQTEQLADLQLPWTEKVRKRAGKSPLSFYLGSITLITILLTGIGLLKGYEDKLNYSVLIIIAILSLTGASQLALAIVNWIVTQCVRPSLLPRLDFSKGIPDDSKTLVVVPTLISSIAGVSALTEGLEIRFLANRDRNLYYGLLTDFTDAKEESLPEDKMLMEAAQKKIEALNQKYGNGEDVFFLFHRPRKWNKGDKIWMGYERKRGKLTELNDLLLHGNTSHFSLITGNTELLKDIKYVITLDTDTQFPRDAGWKLVATMAHPLNRPYYDEKKLRVTEGYGILQPRVAISLPRANNSLYTQMHSNDAGIDPYTRLVSDVYQDLFGEGSFIGKGIYDVATFEHTLNNRFPENRILSHDLLEGCYTRSGLLSDVQLYEENPSRYSADVSRRHRWIRGDWQILWWYLPWVPDAKRHFHKNPLSALSRWKIFDNMRRSLVPIALVLLLAGGWTVFHAPAFWTLLIIAVIILPSLISAGYTMSRKPTEVLVKHHIISNMKALMDNLMQNVFTIICLPYEAYYTADAIIRTSWRMLVSHKHLLEWTPSTSSEFSKHKSLKAAFVSMWISPFTGIAGIVLLSIFFPASLPASIPMLLLWIAAPGVAWAISKPPAKQEAELSDTQINYLRRIARKTWSFFETFVGPDDNWLPPDNYQERPKEAIAHRTSPTNIGLALLANLSAYDFGYIPQGVLLERTNHTMKAMEALERYRGHFYNWYDTISLTPLHPRYISAVDSGNLAGHILTLKQGLLALTNQKIIDIKLYEGLLDAIAVLEENEQDIPLLHNFKTTLQTLCKFPLDNLDTAAENLKGLVKTSDEMLANVKEEYESETKRWLNAINQQCHNALNELLYLAPWVNVPKPEDPKTQTILNTVPTLRSIIVLETLLNINKDKTTSSDNPTTDSPIHAAIATAVQHAKQRIADIKHLAAQCDEYADIEYGFLYDRTKHLLTIGYNADEHRKDAGSYDLLASEARLCNFVAIAQGKLPQESWFALGRLLTNAGGDPILLSWSGSMFEYLMPMLVMPTYENTLLDQTSKAVVARQIAYGIQRGVPWGISESGYNMVDANLNYQYRAFGVPGLGLKRGLSEDLVIAPYATVMSLMVAPTEACSNLERLSASGFEGKYGFYEAIDYTPTRLPRGQGSAIIQSFMVHHQGMSLLSLAYLLLDQPMQKRFEAELEFQATLLLLQERIPRATLPYMHTTDVAEINFTTSNTEMRVINTPHTPIPEVQLLSNGKYHSMVTNAGGSYSRWKDISVTRWREDVTCDNYGPFCYIRDLDNDSFWSNTYQPTLKEAKSYEVTFTQGRAEFRRNDNSIETYTEIVISPEDDIELRRVHITNRSRRRRLMDITSYAEIVLAPTGADAAHPAFSNLFVQTEISEKQNAIICTRRPRSAGEQTPWLCHIMKAHNVGYADISYETDRMKFTGRGNSTVHPAAMNNKGTLSGSQGSVLDPIASIRYRFMLEPGQSAVFDMIIGVSDTRSNCQTLIDKYQDRYLTDRVLEMAWTHSQVVLRQINASEENAQLYNKLASSVIFTNPLLRADAGMLISNQKGQSGLWSYSISGDLPIVLLKIQDSENITLAKQLIQAHTYWRLKGLHVDLVIWNEDHGGYRQNLHDQINGLISADIGANSQDRTGSIFIRQGDQIPQEDRILFQTVARVIISDDRGTLSDQINRRGSLKAGMPLLNPSQPAAEEQENTPARPKLIFNNGLGGFSADGKEYIIITSKEKRTPAPWVNVIANPNFGTVISESGQAYTWTENAHEMRLSPWNNDPVTDSAEEAFYLRDEESGQYWSPCPLPASGVNPYMTRHGFGYSIFEYNQGGIHSEMSVFTDLELSVKYTTLKIRNDSGNARRLSVTGYVAWVLGDLKAKTNIYVVTGIEANTGAIFAKNSYNTEFPERIVFLDTDDINRSITGDRTEFIGRNGSLSKPDAMTRTRLSGKTGPAMDPCAAIQITIDLAENEEREIVFRLGAGKNMNEATNIIRNTRGAAAAREALEKVKAFWANTLNTIQVATPDTALNFLANGWLSYQTLACRVWARSGYYQSGGAFGFRDQLQDVLSLVHLTPDIVRNQILLSASRQFKEGDVQHWWHPPTGRGVRTRCSDDYLWLPFVSCRYVNRTGDTGILDEPVTFLEGRLLNPDEESYYDLPQQSHDTASLYEHCTRAIKHGLKFGPHGLPLIGSGDWNDGMDKVGEHGKGESIWLAFFLYTILIQFADIASQRNDADFAAECKQQAATLKENIAAHGWDGEWYRRAYFDDGTPLGSAKNEECRIDSIAQSWSILSGAGEPERQETAMASANKYLVRREQSLIQLLDPPFDKSALDPGYIKGYVPGVRENGGQYTHSAIWLTMAAAKLGKRELTKELLDIINPIHHGNTSEGITTYKVEPYVIAADVYAREPHIGRGGWTWYTGSAGWMHQLILESFLGLQQQGDQLSFNPCIPGDWQSFDVHYRYRKTMYHIHVVQKDTQEKTAITLDGERLDSNSIKLSDDGKEHTISIEF